MIPTLIVTVDTEEEGLWSGAFRRCGNTVENTRGIDRFQGLCDCYGVRPTYLVDTPVVEDDRSVDTLRNIQQDGRCEVGTHLHPWCAAPYEEEVDGRNSFLCNLPKPLQREKLKRLTEAIDQRFGLRPTSFRAGRYGLDSTGARILADLGYVVDSSVTPFTDHSADGGPNFEHAPFRPYYVGDGDLCTPSIRGLLELPVSVGYSHSNFLWAHRIRTWALRPMLRSFRLPGILDRLRIARRIRFSPEQADAAELRKLVNVYLALEAPCMVMMLHSSSLVAGCSPYVESAAQLEEFYRDLAETFHYCRHDRGMASCTLTEFASQYMRLQERPQPTCTLLR